MSNWIPIANTLGLVERHTVSVPDEIIILLLIVGLIILLWDLFERKSKSLRATSGFGEASEPIAFSGSDALPSKALYSENLGLASKPNALIKEDGYVIPVDVKPKARKVQDRHVVQLLAHCRLVEELYHQRPPYGLLILGTDKRRVRIANTEEKQRWLDTLLDEMHSILDGVPAVPAPSLFKCKNCDVEEVCEHSALGRDSNTD